MKTRPLHACLATGLAGLLTACSLQEPDFQDVSLPGDRFFARIESVAEPETKVYADDKLRVLWDANDHISIFNRYTYNQEYRFTGKTGDNSGSFKMVPNDDFVTGNALDLIYAVYPYLESTSIDNDGALTVSLPDTQAYRKDTFGLGANTMVSCTANNQLLFKNLCGYMLLRLYGEGVTVSSISIKGNQDEPLAGEAVVLASPDDDPSLSFQESATGEITLVMENPVTLGSTARDAAAFWIVIPPTTFSEGFTLTVSDPEGNTFEKSTTKSISIGRNMLFRMSALNVTMTGATDLSAKGTANSYLVPSAGTYKFKADVKGNGLQALDGTPATAEVLWETYNTDVAPEAGSVVRNVRYKDGYIFFETPGNDGNALIVVKDAAGTILWSWHIWSTPYDPETEFDTYTPSGAEMMNRNLGALSNTPGDALANGFLYQWGRKDPFLGSSSNSQSVTSAATPEGVANQMVPLSEESGSVDYVTRHPNHFIQRTGGDWLNQRDYSLWATDKTPYDPCPPGWKVPSASVFASWTDTPFDFQHLGITFGDGYSTPATWYPFSGQIFGILTDVGDRFDHWTVTNAGYDAVSPHAGPDYFNMNSYYDQSAIGQSVRCVRESYQDTQAAPVAVDMGLSVKWSSFCLGATKPEEYNKDYAWGALAAAQDGGSYRWGEYDSPHPLKYNSTDNLSVLQLEDDAAAVIWGDLWRMPTLEEVKELENPDNCTWTLSTHNGVEGFDVVSKINGNRIFMPMEPINGAACMWTSNIGLPISHSYVMSYSKEDGYPKYVWGWRAVAHGVRPVYGEWVHVTGVSLNQGPLSLKTGEVAQLTADIAPQNAFERNVFWSSSDESVATVSAEGIVTARGAGSATITVRTVDGGKTATCTVSVEWSIPLNQIWYTSIDGEIILPTSGTTFYNAQDEVLTYTNTQVDGKWVMEFSDDVAYWKGNWFHNYPGFITNRVKTLGLPHSLQGGKICDSPDIPFYAVDTPTIELFYGDYAGIADNGHLFLLGEDYTRVKGCASTFTGTIRVPEGITYLHFYAFQRSRMSTLILPSTIEKLDEYCLESCDLLTEIYCYAQECPETEPDMWTYVNSTGTLHYPAGSDYSRFDLPAGWTRIGDL